MFLRLAVFLFAAAPAFAEAPRVAADILPVHSLVARVMQGVGTPELILPPGASPHGYAMRPSEALTLEQAELVIWIGEGLTPWLARPIGALAPEATVVALLDHPDTIRLAAEDRGGDGHDHGPTDPHAWLDPENGRIWLGVIADALAGLDPENADRYRANAAVAEGELAALAVGLKATLAPLSSESYAVYHDAYRYLEERFGLHPRFALLSSEAEKPGPRRIARLRTMAREMAVSRVFSEPQVTSKLIPTVFEGIDFAHCELDPLGAGIAPGPSQYTELLQNLASGMAGCARSP